MCQKLTIKSCQKFVALPSSCDTGARSRHLYLDSKFEKTTQDAFFRTLGKKIRKFRFGWWSNIFSEDIEAGLFFTQSEINNPVTTQAPQQGIYFCFFHFTSQNLRLLKHSTVRRKLEKRKKEENGQHRVRTEPTIMRSTAQLQHLGAMIRKKGF